MRNLKRVLTLVMAVAMMMSLLVVGAGATFPDQDKIENVDAVNMNVALGIIKGRDTGEFDPTGNVTRAEMAKMICIVLNGGNEPSLGTKATPTFTDIKGHWAESYIEYCAGSGIVAGMGDGTFAPNANVTATQAAKMLLVALGYDAVFEGFNGTSWSVKINIAANQKALYDELGVFDPSAPLNRDNAAQMVWNTLNAKEVKYEYSLTTVNGQLMNIQNREDKQTDLLGAKFNTCGDYQGIMTGYSWNDNKKEFTYTIAYEYTLDAGQLDTATTTTFTSKTDYTALFGMNVNVVHKANTSKTVYGIYAVDSEIVATGVIDDIEYTDTTTIKIDGKSFKVDNTMSAANKLADLVAYEENKMTTLSSEDVDGANSAYTMKAIDLDGDGKVDYVVYLPFSVGEVTYVGSKSITVDVRDADGLNGSTKSYKFDTDEIYSGVAEDDYVVIVAGANTAYTGEVIKKMDSVSGKLDSRSGSTTITYYLNGKGYDGLFTGSTPVLDNSYTFYVVAGNAYFFDLGEAKANIKDLVAVAAYESGGDITDAKVRVYYTDGTSRVLNVDKIEMYTSATAKTTISVKADIENKLFTIKEKDGLYNLMLVNDYNQLGFGDNDTGNGLTKATDKNALIDGHAIADDAIVFAQYLDGSSKVKVLSGTAAQKYKATGTGSIYLYDTVNGMEKIKVALVYGASAEPISEGDIGNYAYVVSTVRTNGDGDKLYTIWNGKENKSVVDDSATTVVKGAIIAYTDEGDGNITDVFVIGKTAEPNYTTRLGAIIGFSSSAIRLTEDLTDSNAAVSYEIDEDTVYLYIDSDDVSGVAGGRLRTAAIDVGTGDRIPNAFIYTDDNDNDLVKLVVIDTANNELAASFVTANS